MHGSASSEPFNFIPNYNPPQFPNSTTLPKTNIVAFSQYKNRGNDDYENDDIMEGDHYMMGDRIIKLSRDDGSHYSSLYVNNQELLENSGFLAQHKHMTLPAAIPPPLPMRNISPDSHPCGSNGSRNSNAATIFMRHHNHHHQHHHQPNV